MSEAITVYPKLSRYSDTDFEYIVINIGGKTHITRCETLLRFRQSRLAQLTKDSVQYDGKNQWYFFDRSPAYFDGILDTYRCGEFHIPSDACLARVMAELDYWRIPRSIVAKCCQRKIEEFYRQEAELDALIKEFKINYKLMEDISYGFTPTRRLMFQIWMHLEYPCYTRLAKIIGIVVAFLVMASVVMIALEFDPALRVPLPRDLLTEKYINGTEEDGTTYLIFTNTIPLPEIQMTDYALNTLLTLEFVTRFVTTPFKIKFLKSVMNWVEFLACFSFWGLVVGFYLEKAGIWKDFHVYGGRILVPLLLLRFLRVFRLGNVITTIKVVAILIKKKCKELCTLGCFFLFASFAFAFCILMAEMNKKSGFSNLFTSSWWALITMTTVGYGDIVPETIQGHFVASICALVGLLLSGMIIPIIGNNFTLYYNFANSHQTEAIFDDKKFNLKRKIQKTFKRKIRPPKTSAKTTENSDPANPLPLLNEIDKPLNSLDEDNNRNTGKENQLKGKYMNDVSKMTDGPNLEVPVLLQDLRIGNKFCGSENDT